MNHILIIERLREVIFFYRKQSMLLEYVVPVMVTTIIFTVDCCNSHVTSARFRRDLGVEPVDCQAKISELGIKMNTIGIKLLYPSIEVNGRYYVALKELYDKMTTDDEIKTKINRYLSNFKVYAVLENASNWDDSIVHLYTREFKGESVYTRLNAILRQHNCSSLNNVDNVTYALSPYSAALTAILLYGKYEAVSRTTYRGSVVLDSQLKLYYDAVENKKPVLWTSFGSSSIFKNVTQYFQGNASYTFINDGDFDKKWKPKMIDVCSAISCEREALFPPGSIFGVASVDEAGFCQTGRCIQIKLVLKAAEDKNPNEGTENGDLFYLFFLLIPLIAFAGCGTWLYRRQDVNNLDNEQFNI